MSGELYKKYRPKSFKTMRGNEGTVEALKAMVRDGELPHTILFHGPSGCGKTTLARILAKKMNCASIDLIEMNCASNRGIEAIRGIQRVMSLAPAGDCRVWIMDEAHRLTAEAQDATLKMFEDTPDHVYFVLCTTEPQKLLKTIRTRCTPMPVVPLDASQLCDLVRSVLKRAKIDIDKSDPIVEEIAEIAEGSARQALVLLDKVRHLPEGERADALALPSDSQAQTLELCRALFSRKQVPWSTPAGILKDLKEEPERVRRAVLGYARAVILKTKSDRAYVVIRAFENHFYDSGKAGLAAACYDVLFGEE